MSLFTKPLKNNLFTLCIILLFISGFTNINAQDTDKLILKANKLYDQQKYQQALKVYLKKDKQVEFDEWINLQIARCYESLNDYSAADRFYEQLFYKSSSVDPIAFLEYGELLMKLGRNNDARSYFTSYSNLIEQNDLRALKYIESIEDYDKYFMDSAFINLTALPQSTQGNDINPFIYGDKLYLVSNEKYISSSPAHYDMFFIKQDQVKQHKERLIGQNMSKVFMEGFTIAQSTGEFFYSLYDPENNKSQVYRSFIDSEGAKISKSENINIGSFNHRISFPTVNFDGSKLIFASKDDSGVGGWDLYIAIRNSYGYSEPTKIEGFINTLGDELYPYLLNDSILFFASDGHGGVGGLDIYYINLNTPTVLPKNLGSPVNSSFDEMGICVSGDGKIGYLSSERSSNSFADIFEFKLEKIRAWGEVTDKQSGDNLKNVAVDVTKEGETTSKFALADNGRFSVMGDRGDAYSISVWREGYELEKFYINTNEARIVGLYEVDMGKFPILKSDKPPELKEPEIIEPEPIEPEPIAILPVIEEELIEEEPKVIEEVPVEPIEIEERKPVNGIKFRLQIAAARRPLTNTELKSIYSGDREIFEFTEDKWYKYSIGEFSSYFEANDIRRKCGVKNAFVAAYQEETKLKLMSAIDKIYASSKVSIPTTDEQHNIINTYVIHYPLDGYHPFANQDSKLDELVQQLQTDADLQVEIVGHTDKLGSSVYNMGLANERANYIRSFLAIKGISEDRIYVHAYGESKLKKFCTENCTPAIHRENRRVEITLYK